MPHLRSLAVSFSTILKMRSTPSVSWLPFCSTLFTQKRHPRCFGGFIVAVASKSNFLCLQCAACQRKFFCSNSSSERNNLHDTFDNCHFCSLPAWCISNLIYIFSIYFEPPIPQRLAASRYPSYLESLQGNMSEKWPRALNSTASVSMAFAVSQFSVSHTSKSVCHLLQALLALHFHLLSSAYVAPVCTAYHVLNHCII